MIPLSSQKCAPACSADRQGNRSSDNRTQPQSPAPLEEGPAATEQAATTATTTGKAAAEEEGDGGGARQGDGGVQGARGGQERQGVDRIDGDRLILSQGDVGIVHRALCCLGPLGVSDMEASGGVDLTPEDVAILVCSSRSFNCTVLLISCSWISTVLRTGPNSWDWARRWPDLMPGTM
ncbi:hypothetical protein GY45DRAFT_416271 [Cubamyces sp. BRFM 1775]|nr:hypothetical protein GY45DRAFT_416271 [Cubamyces sp. BRFM 1775]